MRTEKHNLKKILFNNSAKTRVLMFILVFGILGVESALAGITITPVTWNVIGLDSNNVSAGPNLFPVGARICNTGGSAVNNLVGKFFWDSSNSYINLDNGIDTLNYSSLAAGGCLDFYFDVVVTRTSAAYNATRRFHIEASGDGVATVSTPTPRELYVEKLVSQNRNSIVAISGPTTVYVGQTYTYTIDSSTATGGYEQLEAFLNLSNVLFQILSISTTYTAPSGGTNDKIYADACGWDNNPGSSNYRSCIGPNNYPGGKAGGTIKTVYTVKVLSTGSTTASTLIYDFSGSSFHYNSDYGAKVISVTALPAGVPQINLNKTVSPAGTPLPGSEITYSISFTNTGSAAAANFRLTDPNPADTSLRLNANTDFKLGSAVNSLGTTGLTATVNYSNDNGATYTYTPVSGAGGAPPGFDRNVTHLRWIFAGNLSQTAPDNTGSIAFTVRIR